MKKIFTLAFALGTFALVQAQPGTRDNRDNRQPVPPVTQRDNGNGYDNGYENQRDVVVYNNPYDNNNRSDSRFSMERKKKMEILRINREYDMKIQRVRNSFLMFRFEKERQIRMLEQQRQWEIRQVNMRFKSNDRRYDRNDDRGYNDRDNSRDHY